MEQLLLSYGATPTKGHSGEDWPSSHTTGCTSPRSTAARRGDLKEAKELIAAGADLTARDEHLRSTPLAWAAKFGQLEMVTFLLDQGAAKSLPDDPKWATPLAWAVRRGPRQGRGAAPLSVTETAGLEARAGTAERRRSVPASK